MASVKLAEYVAQFLADQGVRQVFVIAGGASLHLIHGIACTEGIEYVCPGHEQGGAFAADGYARAAGGIGVAIGTSGPGATNMITGIAGAYYDSVPVLFITGQVSTFRFKGATGVRQLGFQETDTLGICRPITKYAVQVTDPHQIRYELEKALHMAQTGRPGPVLVDLPDDVQRMLVNPEELPSYTAEPSTLSPAPAQIDVKAALDGLMRAQRPVLIVGWGVRVAQAEEELRALLAAVQLPVAVTWAAADMVPTDYPALIGTFGTHGTRYGNFAVQNADFILSIGARLDTREAGTLDTFARAATKVVVDIDPHELAKLSQFGLHDMRGVVADARQFITAMKHAVSSQKLPTWPAWRDRIQTWKAQYPICPASYHKEERVNPYVFVETLAQALPPGQQIVVDTGCAVAWMLQAFAFKEGQRLYHDFNNTAMGWALPASVGVSLARGRQSVVCVTGDGSLHMNTQELATVARQNLPIIIFLLDNGGYSMIQQTQDQWLGGNYEASSVAGGLGFPNWQTLGRAYGLTTHHLTLNNELSHGIASALQTPGPTLCVVEVDASHRVVPQVKYGRPIEDAEPLLPRTEFKREMLIPPLPEPADVVTATA